MADNRTPTITAQRLDANDSGGYWSQLTQGQRADMCDLIRTAGLSPHETAAVEFDLIDCPLLRFDVYLERDGFRYLDCDHDPFAHYDDCQAATATVERVAPSLPSWWQPTITEAGA